MLRNPGDGQAWIDLAIACGRTGDPGCQRTAAERAVATAEFGGPELITGALLLDDLGDTEAADAAYRRALLSSRLVPFAIEWPRPVLVGDATLPEDDGAIGQLSRLLALESTGEPLGIDEITDDAVRAVAYALEGDDHDARDAIESAIATTPDQPLTWDVAVVLASHFGDPMGELLRVAAVARGGPFPDRDVTNITPRLSYDLAVFRSIPADGMLPEVERLRTRPPWPWILEDALP